MKFSPNTVAKEGTKESNPPEELISMRQDRNDNVSLLSAKLIVGIGSAYFLVSTFLIILVAVIASSNRNELVKLNQMVSDWNSACFPDTNASSTLNTFTTSAVGNETTFSSSLRTFSTVNDATLSSTITESEGQTFTDTPTKTVQSSSTEISTIDSALTTENSSTSAPWKSSTTTFRSTTSPSKYTGVHVLNIIREEGRVDNVRYECIQTCKNGNLELYKSSLTFALKSANKSYTVEVFMLGDKILGYTTNCVNANSYTAYIAIQKLAKDYVDQVKVEEQWTKLLQPCPV